MFESQVSKLSLNKVIIVYSSKNTGNTLTASQTS